MLEIVLNDGEIVLSVVGDDVAYTNKISGKTYLMDSKRDLSCQEKLNSLKECLQQFERI